MEEVSSLRVSLGLDTAEFSQRIQDVNRKLRAIKSEFSAASDGTKAWANSLEGMQAKTENLTRQLEVHRQKVASLRQQYEDVVAAQGAESRAAENLLVQYNNAVGVMRRVESSLQNVNRRVQEQTSEFGTLQRRVNASVESMDRELRVLESSFEQVASSMGHAHGAGHQMAQTEEELNRRHDQLNQSIDIQRRRLAELRTLLEATTTAEGANSRATQEMQIRYNQAAQALNRTQAEMHQVHSQIQTQSSAWGRLGQALGGSMSQLGMVGMNLQMTGMNIAMTFGAASVAVGGALGAAVKKSLDFGSQMSKVGAIAGATGKDLDRLKQSALDLGAKTSLSASQVAEAQTEMAKKGYNTNQIIAAMPGVISAAEASGEDLAMVADTVSSAINSFGLAAGKSSHVADILAKAANDSAAGIEDMQYAFKYAGAPAHALGISLEELAASTEIMADSGIKGETAGTTLRSALLRMVKPPKQARKALEELKVSITDSHKKMLPFSNIIGQLNDKTKGMSNAQKTAALAAIFGTEAVSGMLAVVNAGAPKIDKLTESLEKSDGASKKAADQMKKNLKGALQELSGKIETAAITIGDKLTPAIEKIAKVIGKIADAFNNLSPGMQKFIAIGGALTAILLAIVTAFGFITMAIGGTIMAWSTLTAAIAPIGAVITTSILPIAGIIAGIAAAAILLYQAWKTNFGGLRDFTSQVWTLVVKKFDEVKSYVMPLISQLASYISQQWKTIGPMVSTVMNVIGKVIKFILPMIFDTVKFYLNAVVNVFKGVFNIIAGVIKVFTALFSGDWKGMWAGIKQVLTGAVQAIWGLFNLWFVGKIAGVLGKFIGKGLGFITKFAIDGAKWIGKFASQAFSKIASFVTNIVTRIGTGMAQFGGVIARWLVKAVKSYIDFQINAVKAIAGMVSKMASIGVNVAKGLWEGIKSMGSWVAKQVKKWALSVIPASIADALGIHSPSRVTKKQGEHTAQGLADGIISKSKTVEAAARSAAAKAKKGFDDGLRNIQYRVDAKKIGVAEAIKELDKLKAKYKTVPNAVEQANKEIFNLRLKSSKDALKFIKDEAAARSISTSTELTLLEQLAKKYKKNSSERLQVEKEIAKVKDKIAKDQVDKLAKQFEGEKAYIEKKKNLNQLSLTHELADYQIFLNKYKKGSEQRKYWEQQIYNVKKQINDQLASIDTEYAQKAQDINQKLKDDIKSVSDAYNQAVTDRTGSLYSFTGLFDQVNHASDVSGQQLIDNLKGQVDTFAEWSENIKSLSAKGIDQGLIKELQDMGPQAADQIAALNTLSGPQLDQYVALWKQKHAQAKDEATTELSGMKTETDKQIKALQAQASKDLDALKTEWVKKIKEITTVTKSTFDTMPAIGKYAIQGLIDGMKGMSGPLQAQAKAMAESVSATIKKTLGIHSPSRIMRDQVGKFIPLGLAEGISKNISAVISATNQMTKATMPSVSGKAIGQSIVNNTSNTPITVNLNYNGSGSKEDAYEMIDIVSTGINNRVNQRLRMAGVR